MMPRLGNIEAVPRGEDPVAQDLRRQGGREVRQAVVGEAALRADAVEVTFDAPSEAAGDGHQPILKTVVDQEIHVVFSLPAGTLGERNAVVPAQDHVRNILVQRGQEFRHLGHLQAQRLVARSRPPETDLVDEQVDDHGRSNALRSLRFRLVRFRTGTRAPLANWSTKDANRSRLTSGRTRA